MSKEKIRDLIICAIALIVLALVLTTNVFATDLEQALGETDNYTQIQEASNTANNTNTNVNTNTNTNVTNTNNNTNSNTNKTAIPYTGVDYSVIAIIAVCGISAVYAYKKIRDYKSL